MTRQPDSSTAPNQRFVDAIEAIYSAALEPETWPATLQAIADCTGDVGAILIYGRDDGTFGVIESRSLAGVGAEYARDGWSLRDIRALRTRERGYFLTRDVITDRDVVTADEVENDPFYADLLARHGLKYFAAAMVSPNPRTEVGLSVQRAAGRPEYTESELATVSRLGRHVEKALRFGMRLFDNEMINVGLGEALTRTSIGAFVLDRIGRVIFSNGAADGLLGDGIDVLNGRLALTGGPAAGPGSSIHDAVNEQPLHLIGELKPIVVQRSSARGPLVLYLVPIPAGDAAISRFMSQAHVIVLALNSDKGKPVDASLVRDILGLTLGEARIAALVGSGLPPRTAAERLGISEETARTVLKRVFAKVGVSRQTELSELLARLVLRQSD